MLALQGLYQTAAFAMPSATTGGFQSCIKLLHHSGQMPRKTCNTLSTISSVLCRVAIRIRWIAVELVVIGQMFVKKSRPDMIRAAKAVYGWRLNLRLVFIPASSSPVRRS